MGRKKKIIDEQKNKKYMKLVSACYRECFSLKAAAVLVTERTGRPIAYQKVRKILITLGEYACERSVQVAELERQGLTVDEIAAALQISRVAVSSYLPYKKGMYNRPVRTMNAKRVERCRKKKSILNKEC